MSRYSLSHLSDQSLLHDLAALVARDRAITAALLAHIAEVDSRKLYVPAGYSSMYAWCVGELRLSEEAAFKRIHAARAARRFPVIFEAIAQGRLHLSAVVLLAPRLTEDTADALLLAASCKSKAEIERLLAERFPSSDVLPWVTESAAPPAESSGREALKHVEGVHAPAPPVGEHAPGRVQGPVIFGMPGVDRSGVKPLSARSYDVQFTLGQEELDRLRYAQELLSHEIPSGDIAEVFKRALDVLIPQLEKRRFAATDKPRPGHGHSGADSRRIPAHVRRAVWERDGGQCTFVSESGHRCEARSRIEFDHIEAYARGGQATVSGIRLRCRAHNLYSAERTFGPEFMRHKRIAAAEARAAVMPRTTVARAEAAAGEQAAVAERAPAAEQAVAAERARELDVVPWLRALGFSASEARHAATRCDDMPDDASLEQRVRVALSHFRVRGARIVQAACQP